MKIKTPEALAKEVKTANPNSHFFDAETMQYFGDSWSNYQVRGPVEIESITGEILPCYVLSRKKPVKHGLKKNAYFCAASFRQVWKKEG